MAEENYGKRPLWQWVAIYLVIGLIVYGLVYYFVFAKKGYVAPSMTQQTNSDSAPVAQNSVEISSYTFSPSSITVKVGDTVTWTNKDGVGHSATADDGSFDTGLFGQGKTGSFTFTKAGTYKYHCSAHPTMTGTVTVQ